MRLIAHRGNLTGSNPERENTEAYILEALKAGFDVEVDVWGEGVPGGECAFMLGHDRPGSIVSGGYDLLSHPRIWKHAKNALALEALLEHKMHPFFYHDRDRYTLTSNGIPWIFPGEQYVEGGIMVFNGGERPDLDCGKFYGICSDNVAGMTHLWREDIGFAIGTATGRAAVAGEQSPTIPREAFVSDSEYKDYINNRNNHAKVLCIRAMRQKRRIKNLSVDPVYGMPPNAVFDKIKEIIDRINEKG